MICLAIMIRGYGALSIDRFASSQLAGAIVISLAILIKSSGAFSSIALVPNSHRSWKGLNWSAQSFTNACLGEFVPGKVFLSLVTSLVLLIVAGCRSKSNSPDLAHEAIAPANVDSSPLINADQQPGNGISYGRTYSEQRFIPLKQTNDQNVGPLPLARDV